MLTSFVCYIKLQFDQDPDFMDVGELGALIQVTTTQGWRNPHTQAVHFPTAYGNRIDLAKDLSGTVEVEVPVIMAEITYSALSVPPL